MAEDEDAGAPPRGAHPNRTMQVDALTDVQLVDSVAEDDAGEHDEAAAPLVSGRAPPPLPPARKRSPLAVVAGFVGVLLVTGVLGGLGAHFLLPPAPVAPPAVAPPEAAASAAPPPAAEPVVRRMRLDEEFVIGGPVVDAGPAPE